MAIPTGAMATEARKGLDWRKEFNRGGTAVGVARARDIIAKKDLPAATIGRMVSFFARHEVDKQAEGFSPGEKGFPSAGRIAWALWGGDPGKSWADKEWKKIQNSKGSQMDSMRKQIMLDEVELKFTGNSKGSFKGYASVFGGVDSYSDTILRGAYTEVVEAMQDGDMPMPKMFINHRSWMIPPGKWMRLEEDSKGLMVEGEFTPGNPEADIIKAAMQHGTVDGLSIGFRIGDYEMTKEGDQQIRVIKSIAELPEISIVTYPADDAARVDLSSVKSTLDQIDNIRDFEAFLREAGGFSKALATATASRAKRLFAQSESEKQSQLPDELQQIIVANLVNARTL